MNYELAKELKEAGFPQIGNGRWIGSQSELVWRSGNRVYVPTLEELIEACGSADENIALIGNTKDGWEVHASSIETPDPKYPTPTEALARLWLALYAKKGA